MLSEGKANGLNFDTYTSLDVQTKRRLICDCGTFIIDAAISILMPC